MAMLLFMSGSVLGETYAEAFTSANNQYESKHFEQAIGKYKEILGTGFESSAIYFNLGNAYFKKGDLGNAIVNYRRAERLDPTDNDISENLAFARNFTAIQMEGVELNPVRNFISVALKPYKLDLLAWVSSGCFIFLSILLIIRLGFGFKSRILRAGIVAGVTLLLVISMLTTYKYRIDYLTDYAVLVAEDVPIHTGPTEASDIELRGTPGMEVEIISATGDFFNVLFENKRRGWVRKELVAVI
jgi:tetratricopeptide (TPR) repeat protein